MKNRSLKRALFISILVLSIFGAATFLPWAWAAISNISGIAVQGSSIQWNNVKDASQGDALTNGLPASALYGFNGTTWDRLRSDTTYGLDVDVTRVQGTVTMAGGTTPADAFANPTAALTGWSLLGGFNGTTWDRLRTATIGDGAAATGILANGLYGYNGTTWDRLRSDTTNGLDVDVTRVPTAGTAFYSIKRTNIDNSASANLAFGFTSKKIQIETASSNTAEIVIDWIGGTAVAPAVNTAGDDRIVAGRILTLDDYAVTSISLIGVDNVSQTVYVRAWQ